MEVSKPLYVILVVSLLTGLFIIKKENGAHNGYNGNNAVSTPKTTDINEVPLKKTYKKASYNLYPKDLTSARNLLRKALGDFYLNGNNPSIYVEKYGKFGSNVLQLSNAIYLAEVFDISKIYIRNNFCYIRRKITTSKGIEIIPSSQPPRNSIKLGDKLFKMTYNGYNPENRVYEFANETLKSVPKVRTYDNALYIHIRSGDAFIKDPNRHYGQPPLCFYESIIEKWNFNSIYVITEDTKNPVTKKLIEKYKAKLIKSEVFQAMGYIINAKNIVTSSGPYVPSLLRLAPNDSEKRIFRYGEVKSCYEDPCKNYYYTDISNYYMENIMNGNWKNTENQKQIMLNEVCGDKWKSFIYYN